LQDLAEVHFLRGDYQQSARAAMEAIQLLEATPTPLLVAPLCACLRAVLEIENGLDT
jgi:hypothetical protein